MKPWTKTDQKRVRAIIDQLVAASSQAELARELDPDMPRATVNNWRRRGSIPLPYHPAILHRAAKLGIVVTSGQLCLDGRISEKVSKQIAV